MNDGNSQQASCVYAFPQKRSNCPNPLMSPEFGLVDNARPSQGQLMTRQGVAFPRRRAKDQSSANLYVGSDRPRHVDMLHHKEIA